MRATLDLDDYLPYLLNRAGARIADAFGKVTRRHGISLQMWRVLAALHQRDGQSLGTLAATTSIEKSTLSRLLDQMQQKRLVRRQRDGSDQRSIAIHRTAAGEAMTEKLIPVAVSYEKQALIGLDAKQEKTLKASLRRLYENLHALESIEAAQGKTRATAAARASSRHRA